MLKKYDNKLKFYETHVGTWREFNIMAGKYNKPSSQEELEKRDLHNECWVKKEKNKKDIC